MFKNARKVDLQLAATELGEVVTDKMTMSDLINIIKNNEKFETEPEFISNLIEGIIEERKLELETIEKNKQMELQLEQIKLERTKAELELSRMRIESKTKDDSEIKTEKYDSLDSLIKSIKTLTIKIPSRPEGWGFFFASLERSFVTKNVPDKFKAEILLNLLDEKASNIISYINDDELSDYDKVKKIVLREFEPTPQSCLEQFRKTTRQANETHVQFASRLTTSFDYYLKLRDVSDFDNLKKLIVSDKLFQTLDKETASHISIRQSDSWFDPLTLGKEADLFFVSRGKPRAEINCQKSSNSKNVSKVFLAESKSLKCLLCSESHHPLYKCRNYLSLPVSERVEIVKKNNLCFNCLGKHQVKSCKSRFSCSLCTRDGKKKLHHFSLHFPRDYESSRQETSREFHTPERVKESVLSPTAPVFQTAVTTSNLNNNAVLSARVINQNKTVLLSTVNCLLRDGSGKSYRARAILDQGAMSNYMIADCANSLNLKRKKINLTVCGIGDTETSIKSSVNATISNFEGNFEKELDFLIVSKITDFMPSKKIEINVQELKYVKLADENFYIPGRIDLLLSAEIFYELLRPGQISPPNSNLIFQNTVFGYVASGSVPVEVTGRVHCGLIQDNTSLNETLEKFWEMEDVQIEVPKNKEAVICEEHFVKNVKRDKTGRYMVKMPLKEDPMCLGKSRDIALKKLNSQWNRFLKEPQYLELYREFLREYEKLDHMKEISECEEEVGTYYIPHLGIYRPDKSTTKLRVVFNASSQTNSGNSLNSIQCNGGVIQEDLFSIMTRFRKHIFAFVADIKQMYRMILIDPSQTKLLRILWREGVNEPVKTYELKTVTYGTVSAPHLATRVLLQLSKDEREKYPLASPVIERDFYMDDVLSGANTLEAAKTLQHQLIGILKSAQMSLHKWCGNNSELIPCTEKEYEFSTTDEIKTLGVTWKAGTDCFTFKVDVEQNAHPTKRSVLSIIARLFDPLGLLGPVITKAKIFMQRLWLLKLGWSERLPEKEAGEWQEFVRSLMNLNHINIERCIVLQSAEVIELHGFCDASEKAYGASIYARSVTSNGEVKVKLVASKSRVSPIKQVTIPRLELCSAVLLTKLMHKVQNALKMDITSVFYWTDSTIVLWWMKKETIDLKTFVANRVASIQEFTEIDQWYHVSSAQNPADVISRGLDPEKIQRSDLWWFGPSFLREQVVIYPDNCRDIRNSELYQKELKNKQGDSMCLIAQDKEILPIINKCSSLAKLQRIIAWCIRYKDNARNPLHKTTGSLTASELSEALFCLVRNVQSVYFSKEIQCIERGQLIPNSSNLLNLSPFLDEKNILRVGGRLRHSNLSAEQRHPMLIPNNNPICDLIINHYHAFYFHTGTEATLANIRTQFWIINGKSTVKRVIKKCLRCLKVSAKGKNQMMADLPSARVNISRVFTKAGLDFCGPFSIKLFPGRVKKVYKCYICIFVCFVVKAIHLEIVNNLSTEAFIGALKRFIARRGRPTDIFSDNGTNFVGANNELRKILKELFKKESSGQFENFLASESIKWHFNPPATPHFGGLWEAGVKSLKGHLKRVVGNTVLTHEEFFTLVTQVEAVLNSRPLCPLSEDPNDDLALTPAHFLVGSSLISLPEPDFKEIPMNRLRRWELVQKLSQTFWNKWSSDYLNRLQARPKWYKGEDKFQENEVVLVKGDENSKLLNWNLAKIIKVHPGKDNISRVVTLKTSKGVYKRPVNKIVKLPFESSC